MKIIDAKQSVILKSFETLGFDVASYREHIKLKNAFGSVIVLPNHKFIKNTTLNRILGEANIDKNHFAKLVQNKGK